MNSVIYKIKKFFIRVRESYSYPPLITHFVCVVVGALIYMKIAAPSVSLPINSIVITMDKKLFINKDINPTSTKFFLVTKPSTSSQVCKLNNDGVKLIYSLDDVYSFQIHSNDINSIKQIYTKKYKIKMISTNSKNLDGIKLCSTQSSKIRYE